MDSSYARFREVRFFGSLDGLRALSIIGVIWFHSWWSTPFYPTLASLPVLRQGEWGVHIFFCHQWFPDNDSFAPRAKALGHDLHSRLLHTPFAPHLAALLRYGRHLRRDYAYIPA